ncbi:uncharacterized protein LACBIDRAFT_315654 [Laccaria bicolor S238N-H82]|uniref:Predicted protein n=1 Tax=Laccaria bicolor (strain S238N-H82 / ATCC MYA-4686) TaxID=486041 RepID=B0D2V0_LACBS|nr:uncharacterized protein LACBIDRAFT_315654 [Laccaria bicolor S238N-H82]EDR10817.1 predicted protein [Laccaria bicolor S238N-H82]|eukprot:XP_001878118.1 predicted protein [Laccaria bicolor S238N-H82]
MDQCWRRGPLSRTLNVEQGSLTAEQIQRRYIKSKGNTAYQNRNFKQAAALYTRAIEVSPKPEPVFYSNRYVNMSPPKHDLVVLECDEALKVDANYVKALNRRAIALEGLEGTRSPSEVRRAPLVTSVFNPSLRESIVSGELGNSLRREKGR